MPVRVSHKSMGRICPMPCVIMTIEITDGGQTNVYEDQSVGSPDNTFQQFTNSKSDVC